MLITPLEKLLYVIEKAREFDAETPEVDSDSGSNPSDDANVAILQDTADNPVQEELVAALDALTDEERVEILALTWLGRGDFDRSEWREALAQAREIHDNSETAYLIGTPLLADYLQEGIAALGHSLADDR
jgi:hypothetical protein